MDTEVLEAIIKNDAVDPTCLEDVPTEPVSIRPDRHDGPRTTLGDKEGLVPGFHRCRDDPRAVRHKQQRLAAGSSIAAAQYGHPSPCLQQPLGDLNHQRRLSRSSDREIANADHRNRKMSSRKPPVLISMGAQPCRDLIRRCRPGKPPHRSLSWSEHRVVIVLPCLVHRFQPIVQRHPER